LEAGKTPVSDSMPQTWFWLLTEMVRRQKSECIARDLSVTRVDHACAEVDVE
jgi:hypothetical protein